jgi:SNF2 family DNA or RNA helicase
MGFLTLTEYDGGQFHQRTDWRDNELKCDKCGKLEEDGCHDVSDEDYHQFKPSVNEVAYMYERLQGLVIIKHAKDCIDLPELRHRQVICKPTNSLLRLAAAVKDSAPNAVTAMTMLRELSDGFQYREEADGTSKCTHCTDGEVDEWFDPEDEERTYEKIDLLDPERVADLQKRRVPCPVCGGTQEVTKYVRTVKEIPCPKAAALKELLDLNEEQGRLVIFAGFTGSIDKCVDICRKQGWDVVRLDGRGYQVTKADGTPVTDVQGLDYWADLAKNQKVAFVAHPESGGMSLTLVEARMEVFWSNSLKPEYRIQAIARIHRLGADMNLGCEIVDLIHLPTDIRALEIIQENRRIELMTMGDVFNDINFSSDN